nr:hypothetical protein [Paenibacillus rigui]
MIKIQSACMTHTKEDGYVGQVEFQVEGHKFPYEITLYSTKGKEWSYGLHFLEQSGSEEQILEVEDLLEENDEYFDMLVEAAKNSLQN